MRTNVWLEDYVLWKSIKMETTQGPERILYVKRVPFWKDWRPVFRCVLERKCKGKLVIHQYVDREIPEEDWHD